MLPGFAGIQAQLVHALSRRGDRIAVLERMWETGVRLPSASHGPVDLRRADAYASDRVGVHATVSAILAAQSLVAESMQGIDQALVTLDELAALLSAPPAVGEDIGPEVDRLLDQYDGAIRAAGSARGERILGGFRAIRFDGRDLSIAGDIRFLRAPRDPVDLVVDVDALGSAPELAFAIPGGGGSQPSELKVEGPLGTVTISVDSTDTVTIVDAINAVELATGVQAAIIPGAIELTTPVAGSQSTITFTPVSGAAMAMFPPEGLSASGTDAQATCTGGHVAADGNLLRVSAFGALVEIDAHGMGILRLTTLGGGVTARRSTYLDGSVDTRLGLPGLLSDSIGFDQVGSLSDLRSGGTLAPSGGTLFEARTVVESVRSLVTRMRDTIADFDSSILERDRLTFEALAETLEAAESRLRLADLPSVALELGHERGAEARAQAALESLLAQWGRLLTILPSGSIGA